MSNTENDQQQPDETAANETASTSDESTVEPTPAAPEASVTPWDADTAPTPEEGTSAPQTPEYGVVPPAFRAEPDEPVQPRKRAFSPLVAGVLVLGLIAGGAGGAATSAIIYSQNNAGVTAATTQQGSTDSTNSGITTTETTTTTKLASIIKSKAKSVVTVGVVGTSESGTGSGVVINDQGYIVTNAHVVTLAGETGSGKITVQTSSGDSYAATLVAYDTIADVAVIKVAADSAGIAPITFADSDDVAVGDTAIVIGSPLGLSNTVTSGIISALNRPIQVQSAAVTSSQSTGGFGSSSGSATSTSTVALSTIQTDAAINEGNSGGALLNANGDLIGLNDAIATSTDSTGSTTNTGNIGIGFSIPSNYVKRIAEDLIKSKTATHGYLGASVSDYTDNDSSFSSGAKISSIVADAPAAKAGLKEGDIIEAVNGTVIEGSTQLTALVKQLTPGTKATVKYLRDGKSSTLTVTLGTTK
jgi:putative serine protease PepD